MNLPMQNNDKSSAAVLYSDTEERNTNPASGFSEALLRWYDENRRILPWREDPTPYHVWLSEIMLQQTRVEAVRDYYERFVAALPDIAALANAPEDQYLKLWEGLGYYSRVRNLHRAAQIIVEEHDGRMPGDYDALLALPGIGPYTAAAIASIAFDKTEPAIDGNLLRVFARLSFYEPSILTPAASREARAFYLLHMDKARPGAFNQALMDLGALVCLPTSAPLCGPCPLRAYCRACALGRQSQVPHRPAKKKRQIEKMTVFLIHHRDQLLLHKRPATGLLAGLYEYPNTPGWLTRTEALSYIEGLGLESLRIRKLPVAKHIFSHKEWHMHGYEVFTSDWTGSAGGAETCGQPADYDGASDAAAPTGHGGAAPNGITPVPVAPPTLDGASLFPASTAEIETVWSVPSAFRVYTDIATGKHTERKERK